MEKGKMAIYLTVESSREKSNNLPGLPDVAFVVEQKRLSLCFQSV